jgi:hypothetical protein
LQLYVSSARACLPVWPVTLIWSNTIWQSTGAVLSSAHVDRVETALEHRAAGALGSEPGENGCLVIENHG